VARVLLALLGIGCVMVTFANAPALALFGFGLMGVGTSALFPLAMSAAAQRTDRPAAANVAALAQTAFVAFLLAPPLLVSWPSIGHPLVFWCRPAAGAAERGGIERAGAAAAARGPLIRRQGRQGQIVCRSAPGARRLR